MASPSRWKVRRPRLDGWGQASPRRRRRSVLFPAPLPPNTAQLSPSRSVKETPPEQGAPPEPDVDVVEGDEGSAQRRLHARGRDGVQGGPALQSARGGAHRRVRPAAAAERGQGLAGRGRRRRARRGARRRGRSGHLPRRPAGHAGEAGRRRPGLRPALRALLLRARPGHRGPRAIGAARPGGERRPRGGRADHGGAHAGAPRRPASRRWPGRRSTGDAALLARLLRGAALTIDFSALEAATQLGFYGRRLLAGAGGAGLAAELDALPPGACARRASTRRAWSWWPSGCGARSPPSRTRRAATPTWSGRRAPSGGGRERSPSAGSPRSPGTRSPAPRRPCAGSPSGCATGWPGGSGRGAGAP